jgi:hypothetical protein
MKIRIIICVVLMLAGISASLLQAAGFAIQRTERAVAATYDYRATTIDRVKKSGTVTAGDRQWQCRGNQCTAKGPWPTPDVQSCQALANQVGQITAYGHSAKQLTASQLSQCNRGVRTVTAPRPAAGFQPESSPARAKTLLPSTTPEQPAKPKIPSTIPQAVGKQPARQSGGFARLPEPGKPAAERAAGGFAAGVVQPPFTPKAITTGSLVIKGTTFSPKAVTTGSLVIKGTTFSPKAVTTDSLVIKGTTFSPKTATTDSLVIKGASFSAKTATTAPLTIKGQLFSPKSTTTGVLTIRGARVRPNIQGN